MENAPKAEKKQQVPSIKLEGLVDIIATENSVYLKKGKTYTVNALHAQKLIQKGKAKLK